MTKKIFITGASGFVGQALVEDLLKKSYDVVGLSRNGPTASQKVLDVEFILADLALLDSSETLQRHLSEKLQDCFAVVHLASRVHSMRDMERDARAGYFRTNVYATETFARLAFAAGVERFVYLSSIKVNGENTNGISFNPTMVPEPNDPYSESKLAAEHALARIAQQYPKLDLVILRPPLIYGANVRANFKSLMNIISALPLLPFGGINNRRTLLYVGNLVSAIEAVLRAPKAHSGVFTLSDDQAVSTADISREIARALKKRLWLVPVPLVVLRTVAALLGRRAQINRLVENLQIDSSAFKQEFAWQPPFSFSEGIRLTVAASQRDVLGDSPEPRA